jgi:hypothetical protein
MGDVKEPDPAIVAAIIEKYDALIARLTPVIREFQEILDGIDQCRAAARLFGRELAHPVIPFMLRRMRNRETLRSFLVATMCELNKARVRDLRPLIDKKFGTVHEKTISMTLYRLKQDGLLSRRGHEWTWRG